MKLQNISIYFFILFLFISCEKEIILDVDDVTSKVVVEASLSDRMGDARVLLTKSISLYETQEPPKISGAEVSIIEIENNIAHTLDEVEEGLYVNENLVGESGKAYQLRIILPDGTQYSSVERMPEKVVLTGLEYQEFDNPFREEDDEYMFEVRPQFIDIANVDNYYHFKVQINGEDNDEIQITKDLGFDGLQNTQRLYIEGFYGDEVKLDLHNITSPAYNYLLGLSYNINQSSGTPTNPETNISGGALGYFKVYSFGGEISFTLEE